MKQSSATANRLLPAFPIHNQTLPIADYAKGSVIFLLIFGILIAALSGILMSVQGVCNANVSQQAGLWVTGTFVSFTAAAVCLTLWFLTGRTGDFSVLLGIRPRYLLLGGVFGAFITGTVVYAIAKLGTAKAELIIVIAQLIAAYVLSITGWLSSNQEPFAWQKFFALAVSLAGVIWYSL